MDGTLRRQLAVVTEVQVLEEQGQAQGTQLLKKFYYGSQCGWAYLKVLSDGGEMESNDGGEDSVSLGS